jgi:hypothetical protein
MKNNNGRPPREDRVTDHAAAAMEQIELYSTAHPGSPSAVRRPRLFLRSELWIALLGPNIEEGIVGIGPTVAAALHAFDAQYLAGLRPPVKTAGTRCERGRSGAASSRARDLPKFGSKSDGGISGFASPA